MLKEGIKTKPSPEIWAVGGGKGGVGKSIISILLAYWLARLGKRTILIDTDLGGANLHTLMGIKNLPYALNDFVSKKITSLEDVCINLDVENLKLISGVSEVLSQANIKFAQKWKIVQHIFRLDSDYIVLDLGAGTSFNVLDFFLIAHKKIVVLTSQPTSIQNAYAFIRNVVYRRLSQLAKKRPALKSLINITMDPNNDLKIRTIMELLQVLQKAENKEEVYSLQKEIGNIKPLLITNMTKTSDDKNAGRVVKLVAEKYLMIHPKDIGEVVYDNQIDSMVSKMIPINKIDKTSNAFASVYDIITNLL